MAPDLQPISGCDSQKTDKGSGGISEQGASYGSLFHLHHAADGAGVVSQALAFLGKSPACSLPFFFASLAKQPTAEKAFP